MNGSKRQGLHFLWKKKSFILTFSRFVFVLSDVIFLQLLLLAFFFFTCFMFIIRFTSYAFWFCSFRLFISPSSVSTYRVLVLCHYFIISRFSARCNSFLLLLISFFRPCCCNVPFARESPHPPLTKTNRNYCSQKYHRNYDLIAISLVRDPDKPRGTTGGLLSLNNPTFTKVKTFKTALSRVNRKRFWYKRIGGPPERHLLH